MPVQVIEARGHLGGNCHTERDPDTGVMVHAHGPHIFHTNHAEVWRYVQRFGAWQPFVNRVKAHTGAGIFSLPINLHTSTSSSGRPSRPGKPRNSLPAWQRRASRPRQLRGTGPEVPGS